jgi:hypothetical protein
MAARRGIDWEEHRRRLAELETPHRDRAERSLRS